jgi:tetratricopeptide (TPR) repeat protein
MGWRVLSYASALGKEFDFEVLQVATGMEEEPLAEELEWLVHRGVLRELAGGDAYEFVQEETQVRAYQTISSSRMRVIHQKIAESYERAQAGDPSEEAIAKMGRHFHLGRAAEKSVMYNRYAATLARGAFSPETAVRYLEWVVEDLRALPGDHRSELSDTLRELGDHHMALGEAARADEMYGKSLEQLPQSEGALRGLLLLSRAEANRVLDRLSIANQYCVEAIFLFQGLGHRKGLAMAHRLQSRTAFKLGDFDLGRREAEAALHMLSWDEDPREVARCYIDLGNAYSSRRDPEGQAECIAAYRRAIDLLTRLQDFRELSRAHNNLAITLGIRDPRGALQELELARTYAEKVRDMNSVGWALFNRVEFLLAVGEEAEAHASNEAAYAILSRMDDQMAIQQIIFNRGILAQHRRAFPEAEGHFLEAQRRADEMGYPHLRAEMVLRHALLNHEWGRRELCLTQVAELEKMGVDNLLPYVRPLYDDLKKKLGPSAGGKG